jgi:hypothetical protein
VLDVDADDDAGDDRWALMVGPVAAPGELGVQAVPGVDGDRAVAGVDGAEGGGRFRPGCWL